jgi:speckle-type POZ protein
MVYPKGEGSEAKNFVSVFFYLLNNLPNYCAYEISIIDESGKLKFTESAGNVFYKIKSGWGWRKFISQKDLFEKENGLIKDNTLTLSGTFKFINHVRETVKSLECERFEQFYQSRMFSDLELEVQGRSIKAHKFLVGASSPVLAERLFDLAETQNAVVTAKGGRDKNKKRHKQNKKKIGSKQTGNSGCGKQANLSPTVDILEIDDLEFEVAEEMVKFIYDGKVENMEKYAKPLLEASNTFKMAHLKVCCENYLCENLTVENAIEFLKLGAKCHAEELKEECVDFILV